MCFASIQYLRLLKFLPVFFIKNFILASLLLFVYHPLKTNLVQEVNNKVLRADYGQFHQLVYSGIIGRLRSTFIC